MPEPKRPAYNELLVRYASTIDALMMTHWKIKTTTVWNPLAGSSGAYITTRDDGRTLNNAQCAFLDGATMAYTAAIQHAHTAES